MISEIDLNSFPLNPGVYLMKDQAGKIIYIGKANSLRKRVSSYLRKKNLDQKTEVLMKKVNKIDYQITTSEFEALILENNLIKKYQPKFNIRLKDDKRYPYIMVTLEENYPRLKLTREKKNKKNKYFGPYPDSKAARNIIDLVNTIFKLKTCQRQLPLKKKQRPCLNYQINKCQGVCLSNLKPREYQSLIKNALQFLEGNIKTVTRNLEIKMNYFSKNLDFEKAAQYRNIINDIKNILDPPSLSDSLKPEISVKSKITIPPQKIKRQDYLQELAKVLNLKKIPDRIECFDISNLQGKQAVASMVSFWQGWPDKKNYRQYKIRGYKSANDPGMIHEVVSRRLQFLVNENLPLPDLMVIDGGKTQLSRALEAKDNLNVKIKIISIAKRLEEIFYDPQKSSIILDKSSKALQIIQHLRNESHRFALRYHLKLRDKEVKLSVLDEIPQIGPKIKMTLLDHFKSVTRIKKATVKDLEAVPGIGSKTAEIIYLFFQNN